MDIAILQQLLNGGTSLLLLAGLVYVFKIWQADRHAATSKERELYDQHKNEIIALGTEQRTFVEEIAAAQTKMVDKMSGVVDRNTSALEKIISDERDELKGMIAALGDG